MTTYPTSKTRIRSCEPITAFLTPSLPHQASPCRKRPPRCASQQPQELQLHTLPTKHSHTHSPIIHLYDATPEEPECFAMWYTTHPPNTPSSINLATSSDGISFTTVEGPHAGAVLSRNEDEWWAFDTKNVSLGDVITSSTSRVRADGEVVFLYYSGSDSEQVFGERFRMQGTKIGVALSKDGQYFSRLEGEFPSGAVVEGDTGNFDEFCVCAPCVVDVGGESVMFYHTFSDAVFKLGRAVSEDGILFRKTGEVVFRDARFDGGVLSPFAIAHQGKYLMFLQAIKTGKSTIAVSESTDCENWGELKVVLEADDNLGTPCAVLMADGSLRLYHSVYNDEGSYITVAECVKNDWTNFEAVTTVNIE